MQFLSPTQLILVLWLLAAAAPVATVLMNGSLVPLPAATAEGEWRENAATSAKAKAGVQRAAAIQLAAVLSLKAVAAQAATAGSTVSLSENEIAPAADASVLHTALQRHRPKSA